MGREKLGGYLRLEVLATVQQFLDLADHPAPDLVHRGPIIPAQAKERFEKRKYSNPDDPERVHNVTVYVCNSSLLRRRAVYHFGNPIQRIQQMDPRVILSLQHIPVNRQPRQLGQSRALRDRSLLHSSIHKLSVPLHCGIYNNRYQKIHRYGIQPTGPSRGKGPGLFRRTKHKTREIPLRPRVPFRQNRSIGQEH